MVALVSCLKECDQLHELKLAGNEIGREGVEEIHR